MANVFRTQNEFESLLGEQVDFLKLSCESYDCGFEGEIKRLAVSVRVLVHDTSNSTSLLTHANKKHIKFLDTAEPYNDQNLLSHSSLVQMFLGPSGSKVRANLDDTTEENWIDFDAWWNGIVLVDTKKNEFSRKDIALFLANKDGGAHVDHQIDERYHNLREKNAMGWVTFRGDGRQIAGEDHVPATMRQIAHELIRSLDSGYKCARSKDTEAGFVMRGASVVVGDAQPPEKLPNLRKDRPTIGSKKVGRNDPCPCGSGKKYKKCCLA